MTTDQEFKLCRLCLCKSSRLIDIFQENCISNFSVEETIRDLLALRPVPNPEFQWLVCSMCLFKLTDFRLFKQRCLESKMTFESRYTGVVSATRDGQVVAPERKMKNVLRNASVQTDVKLEDLPPMANDLPGSLLYYAANHCEGKKGCDIKHPLQQVTMKEEDQSRENGYGTRYADEPRCKIPRLEPNETRSKSCDEGSEEGMEVEVNPWMVKVELDSEGEEEDGRLGSSGGTDCIPSHTGPEEVLEVAVKPALVKDEPRSEESEEEAQSIPCRKDNHSGSAKDIASRTESEPVNLVGPVNAFSVEPRYHILPDRAVGSSELASRAPCCTENCVKQTSHSTERVPDRTSVDLTKSPEPTSSRTTGGISEASPGNASETNVDATVAGLTKPTANMAIGSTVVNSNVMGSIQDVVKQLGPGILVPIGNSVPVAGTGVVILGQAGTEQTVGTSFVAGLPTVGSTNIPGAAGNVGVNTGQGTVGSIGATAIGVGSTNIPGVVSNLGVNPTQGTVGNGASTVGASPEGLNVSSQMGAFVALPNGVMVPVVINPYMLGPVAPSTTPSIAPNLSVPVDVTTNRNSLTPIESISPSPLVASVSPSVMVNNPPMNFTFVSPVGNGVMTSAGADLAANASKSSRQNPVYILPDNGYRPRVLEHSDEGDSKKRKIAKCLCRHVWTQTGKYGPKSPSDDDPPAVVIGSKQMMWMKIFRSCYKNQYAQTGVDDNPMYGKVCYPTPDVPCGPILGLNASPFGEESSEQVDDPDEIPNVGTNVRIFVDRIISTSNSADPDLEKASRAVRERIMAEIRAKSVPWYLKNASSAKETDGSGVAGTEGARASKKVSSRARASRGRGKSSGSVLERLLTEPRDKVEPNFGAYPTVPVEDARFAETFGERVVPTSEQGTPQAGPSGIGKTSSRPDNERLSSVTGVNFAHDFDPDSSSPMDLSCTRVTVKEEFQSDSENVSSCSETTGVRRSSCDSAQERLLPETANLAPRSDAANLPLGHASCADAVVKEEVETGGENVSSRNITGGVGAKSFQCDNESQVLEIGPNISSNFDDAECSLPKERDCGEAVIKEEDENSNEQGVDLSSGAHIPSEPVVCDFGRESFRPADKRPESETRNEIATHLVEGYSLSEDRTFAKFVVKDEEQNVVEREDILATGEESPTKTDIPNFRTESRRPDSERLESETVNEIDLQFDKGDSLPLEEGSNTARVVEESDVLTSGEKISSCTDRSGVVEESLQPGSERLISDTGANTSPFERDNVAVGLQAGDTIQEEDASAEGVFKEEARNVDEEVSSCTETSGDRGEDSQSTNERHALETDPKVSPSFDSEDSSTQEDASRTEGVQSVSEKIASQAEDRGVSSYDVSVSKSPGPFPDQSVGLNDGLSPERGVNPPDRGRTVLYSIQNDRLLLPSKPVNITTQIGMDSTSQYRVTVSRSTDKRSMSLCGRVLASSSGTWVPPNSKRRAPPSLELRPLRKSNFDESDDESDETSQDSESNPSESTNPKSSQGLNSKSSQNSSKRSSQKFSKSSSQNLPKNSTQNSSANSSQNLYPSTSNNSFTMSTQNLYANFSWPTRTARSQGVFFPDASAPLHVRANSAGETDTSVAESVGAKDLPLVDSGRTQGAGKNMVSRKGRNVQQRNDADVTKTVSTTCYPSADSNCAQVLGENVVPSARSNVPQHDVANFTQNVGASYPSIDLSRTQGEGENVASYLGTNIPQRNQRNVTQNVNKNSHPSPVGFDFARELYVRPKSSPPLDPGDAQLVGENVTSPVRTNFTSLSNANSMQTNDAIQSPSLDSSNAHLADETVASRKGKNIWHHSDANLTQTVGEKRYPMTDSSSTPMVRSRAASSHDENVVSGVETNFAGESKWLQFDQGSVPRPPSNSSCAQQFGTGFAQGRVTSTSQYPGTSIYPLGNGDHTQSYGTSDASIVGQNFATNYGTGIPRLDGTITPPVTNLSCTRPRRSILAYEGVRNEANLDGRSKSTSGERINSPSGGENVARRTRGPYSREAVHPGKSVCELMGEMNPSVSREFVQISSGDNNLLASLKMEIEETERERYRLLRSERRPDVPIEQNRVHGDHMDFLGRNSGVRQQLKVETTPYGGHAYLSPEETANIHTGVVSSWSNEAVSPSHVLHSASHSSREQSNVSLHLSGEIPHSSRSLNAGRYPESVKPKIPPKPIVIDLSDDDETAEIVTSRSKSSKQVDKAGAPKHIYPNVSTSP